MPPYQFEPPPVSRLSASIADLIAHSGSSQANALREIAAAQARAAEVRGQAYGGAIQNVGQSIAAIPQQIQQQKRQAMADQLGALQVGAQQDAAKQREVERQQRAQFDAALKDSMTTDPQTGLVTYDRKKAQALLTNASMGHLWPEVSKILDDSDTAIANVRQAHVSALKSMAELVDRTGNDPSMLRAEVQRGIQNGLFTQQEAAPYIAAVEQDPKHVSSVTGAILGKKPDLMNVPADTAVIDKNNPQGGALFTAAPKPSEPKKYQVTVPGLDGRPVNKLFTEDELAQGVPVYKDPKDTSSEPLVAIIGKDGLPVLVPRSQAVGQRPASTREQGRPVTSGDAGDIADLKSSLDDIAVLGKTLGTTGAASTAGAMLPNVVTELTGWGADAKSRQGVIDRVKQVIGKALEGGVLRKEDEIKYVKILPTIGDPPSVAASKLAGLQAAIAKKLQRKVESLADAGYDISKFKVDTPTKVYLDDNGDPKY